MNGKRKVIIMTVLTAMVITLAAVGFYYWYENENYVTTEDAKVTADIVRVSPQISGKILELNFEEGQTVEQDQILGRQEMATIPDTSMELSLVRAPIKGLVIKKQGTIGEIASPGQAMAMLIDPEKMYVLANIEETKLGRITPGEKVDITIDQYEGKTFAGKIKSIGQATSATFSLLPTSSSGNFTKVIQKVPVKISLDSSSLKLIPGTNAVIKIHVR